MPNLQHILGIVSAVFVVVVLLTLLISIQYCLLVQRIRRNKQQAPIKSADPIKIQEHNAQECNPKASERASTIFLTSNSCYEPMQRLPGRKHVLLKATRHPSEYQRAIRLKSRCHSMDDLSNRTARGQKNNTISMPGMASKYRKECRSPMLPKRLPMVPPKSARVIQLRESATLDSFEKATSCVEHNQKEHNQKVHNKCGNHCRAETIPLTTIKSHSQEDDDNHEYEDVLLRH